MANGGLKLAFRVNQEICGTDDSLARMQPFQHDKAVADKRPGFDLARLKVAIAVVNKRNLPCARLQHPGNRNHKLRSERNAQIHIDVHTRLQQQARIVEHHSHTHGAGSGIDLRENLPHASAKCTSGIRIHRDSCGITCFQSANIGLKDLCIYPYLR